MPNRSLALVATLLCALGCGGRARTLTSGDPGAAGGMGGAAADAGASRPPCVFEGFAEPVIYPTANEPLYVVAVEGAHRGHMDLAVGERIDLEPTAEFMTNAGNGKFVLSALPGAPNNRVASLVSADFNGDGKLDLASQFNSVVGDIDLGTGDGVVGVDLGTGPSTFAPQLMTYPTLQTGGAIEVGDFNRDGLPDLAFAGADMAESYGGLPAPEATNWGLSLLLNTGRGGFSPAVPYPNPLAFQAMATGDFNGDGYADVVELTSTGGGGLSVYMNAGDGTLGIQTNYVTSPDWGSYGLGIGDFDGDGNDDIATVSLLDPNSGHDRTVLQVFIGASDGTLSGPVVQDLPALPDVYRIITGDFNGDGKLDLAMILGNGPTWGMAGPIPISVFVNLGGGAFSAPVSYSVNGVPFEQITAIAAGDFNGDGVTDLAATTTGQEPPYPEAVDVFLSECK